MPFHVLENSDITKFEGDVIVNGVGINTKIYGDICDAIIKVSANKEDLKKIINNVNDVYSNLTFQHLLQTNSDV